jgi:hypothetical protein
VLTFRILRIFRQLIIINARIFFYLLHRSYVAQRIIFCHCYASVVAVAMRPRTWLPRNRLVRSRATVIEKVAETEVSVASVGKVLARVFFL